MQQRPARTPGLSANATVAAPAARRSLMRLSQPLPHASLMLSPPARHLSSDAQGGKKGTKQGTNVPEGKPVPPASGSPVTPAVQTPQVDKTAVPANSSAPSASSSSVAPNMSLLSNHRQRGMNRSAASTGVKRTDRISMDLQASKAAALARRKAGTYVEEGVRRTETSPSTPSGLVVGWKFPMHYDPRYEPPPLNVFRTNPEFKFLLFDPAQVGVGSQINPSSIRLQMDEGALLLWHQRFLSWISARAKRNEHVARQRAEYIKAGHPTRLTCKDEAEFDEFVRSDAFHAFIDRVSAEDHRVAQYDVALEPSVMFPFAMDPNDPNTDLSRYHPSFEPVAPEIWHEYGITARDSDEYAAWFHAWLQANPAVARQREVYQRMVAKYVGPVWRARMHAEHGRLVQNELTRNELYARQEAEAREEAMTPAEPEKVDEDPRHGELGVDDYENPILNEAEAEGDRLALMVDPENPHDPRIFTSPDGQQRLFGDLDDPAQKVVDRATGLPLQEIGKAMQFNELEFLEDLDRKRDEKLVQRRKLLTMTAAERAQFKLIANAQLDVSNFRDELSADYVHLLPPVERMFFESRFALASKKDAPVEAALQQFGVNIQDQAIGLAWYRVSRALDRAAKEGRDDAKREIKKQIIEGTLVPSEADKARAAEEEAKELTLLRSLPMQIYRRVVHNTVARNDELNWKEGISPRYIEPILGGRDYENEKYSVLDLEFEPDSIEGPQAFDVTKVHHPDFDAPKDDLGAGPLSLLEQRYAGARVDMRIREIKDIQRLEDVKTRRVAAGNAMDDENVPDEIPEPTLTDLEAQALIDAGMAVPAAQQGDAEAVAKAEAKLNALFKPQTAEEEANAPMHPFEKDWEEQKKTFFDALAAEDPPPQERLGHIPLPKEGEVPELEFAEGADAQIEELVKKQEEAVAARLGSLASRPFSGETAVELQRLLLAQSDGAVRFDATLKIVEQDGSADAALLHAEQTAVWPNERWDAIRVRDQLDIDRILPTLPAEKQEEYKLFREQQAKWDALSTEQRQTRALEHIRSLRPGLKEDVEADRATLQRLADDWMVEQSTPWNPVRPPLGTESWSRAELLAFVPKYLEANFKQMAKIHREPAQAQLKYLETQAKLSHEFRVAEQCYRREVDAQLESFVAKALARTPITELTARAQLMAEGTLLARMTPEQKAAKAAHDATRDAWRKLSPAEQDAEAEKAVASGEAAKLLAAEGDAAKDSYWPVDNSTPEARAVQRAAVISLFIAKQGKKGEAAAAEAASTPDRERLLTAYKRSREVGFASVLAAEHRKAHGNGGEKAVAELEALLNVETDDIVAPVLLKAGISKEDLVRAPGSEHWGRVPIAALSESVQKLAREYPIDFAAQLREQLFTHEEEVEYEARAPERAKVVAAKYAYQEAHLQEYQKNEMEVFRFHSVESAHRATLADLTAFEADLQGQIEHFREINKEWLWMVRRYKEQVDDGIIKPIEGLELDPINKGLLNIRRQLARQMERVKELEHQVTVNNQATPAEALSVDEARQLNFQLSVAKEAESLLTQELERLSRIRSGHIRTGLPGVYGNEFSGEQADQASELVSVARQDLEQAQRALAGEATGDAVRTLAEQRLFDLEREQGKLDPLANDAEEQAYVDSLPGPLQSEEEVAHMDRLMEEERIARFPRASDIPLPPISKDELEALKEEGVDLSEGFDADGWSKPQIPFPDAALNPSETHGMGLEAYINRLDSWEADEAAQETWQSITEALLDESELTYDERYGSRHPYFYHVPGRPDVYEADPLRDWREDDEKSPMDYEDHNPREGMVPTTYEDLVQKAIKWRPRHYMAQAQLRVLRREAELLGLPPPLDSFELANYDIVFEAQEEARKTYFERLAAYENGPEQEYLRLEQLHGEATLHHDLPVDPVSDAKQDELLDDLQMQYSDVGLEPEQLTPLEFHSYIEEIGPNAYVLCREIALDYKNQGKPVFGHELIGLVATAYPRWRVEGRLRVAEAWREAWDVEEKLYVSSLPLEQQDLLAPLPDPKLCWDFPEAWQRFHARANRPKEAWQLRILDWDTTEPAKAEKALAAEKQEEADKLQEIKRFHNLDELDIEWEMVLSERASRTGVELTQQEKDDFYMKYYYDPEMHPQLADEMIPNPYRQPPAERVDEHGHKHAVITDESEIYTPFMTDVSIPFAERTAGSLSEATALHHFEIRRRNQEDIEKDISEMKMWLDNQSKEDHEAPRGRVAAVLSEIKAWKQRQLAPSQEEINTRARALHEHHKEVHPHLVAPPAEGPRVVKTTDLSPLELAPGKPVELEREDTASLLRITSEQTSALAEETSDIARNLRGDQITVEEHPLVVVGANEIDEDTLYEIIMRQIEEYEVVGFDKFGRMLSPQQIDFTPLPILRKALARVGYLPNPYGDAKMYAMRAIGAADSGIMNRDAMIELYRAEFSEEAREADIRERTEGWKDSLGRPIDMYRSHEENQFLQAREWYKEEESEMLEVMSEEEIALWKSYTTDEGMIKWIAEGGLFKAQAAWLDELKGERRLSASELEGSMADLPLQLGDSEVSFEENDEIILKQETERMRDHFEDLKFLQHNPQLYVHFFKDDGSGDFSEEGRKHILETLSKLDSKPKRIAYLKALIEWRRVVGGTNVDQDDWTLRNWLRSHEEYEAAAQEKRIRAAKAGGQDDSGEAGEEEELPVPEGDDGDMDGMGEEVPELDDADLAPTDESELIASDGTLLDETIFEEQDILTGQMVKMRFNADGEAIPLTQWELDQLPKPKLLSLDEEMQRAEETKLSASQVPTSADREEASEEGAGEEGEEEEGSDQGDETGQRADPQGDFNEAKSENSPEAEHPLLAQWARPSSLRHVKELPHMDPARYNEFQAMLHLKEKIYRMLGHHFPASHQLTVKLNQPQLFYPERKFRQHYAMADPFLARAVSGPHSNLQLFQVIFLMRKYRNASLLAEHVAREIGAAKSHSAVLRSIENQVKRMESIPGLDTGLMIKVSGRINGAAMASHYIIKSGNIPLQSFHANVDYGFAHAYHRIGVFGCKVWLFQRKLDRKEMQAQALNKKSGRTKTRYI